MKVLSLESRRSSEIAELIRKQGGEPVLAPSMREAPLERNDAAFQFAERLFAGEFDMMILLTGVGTRLLQQSLATRYPAERFRRRSTADHGGGAWAQAGGGFAGLEVPVTVMVPEPNTWREVLAAIHRPDRAAHRGSGIRPVQQRTARRTAAARSRSDHRTRLPVGPAGGYRVRCAMPRAGWLRANCKSRCSPLPFRSSICCGSPRKRGWKVGSGGFARHGGCLDRADYQ